MDRTPIRLWVSCALYVCSFFAQWALANAAVDNGTAAQDLFFDGQRHAANQEWGKSVQAFQSLIERFPTQLIDVSAKSQPMRRYVNARAAVENRLQELPDALLAYRQRFDEAAKRLYEKAAEARDTRKLQKVGDLYASTPWGARAWDTLGGIEFQEGRFDRAQWAFQKLLRAADQSDPARAEAMAKWILTLIAQGYEKEARREIERFPSEFLETEGFIAGRRGKFVDSLKAALKEDGFAARKQGEWATYGGSLERLGYHAQAVPALEYYWSEEMPRLSAQTSGYQPPREATPPYPSLDRPVKPISYFPSFFENQVWVADEMGVKSYSLEIAPRVQRTPPSRNWDAGEKSLYAMSDADFPRSRLTVAFDDKTGFVRLGPVRMRKQGASSRWEGELGALRTDKTGEWKWKRNADSLTLQRAERQPHIHYEFEGVPSADKGTLYTSLIGTDTRADNFSSYAVALDAATGEVKWLRWIATSRSDLTVEEGKDANLLAFDPISRAVYYQTESGVLAAIDAETGTVLWLTDYSSGNPLKKKPPSTAPRHPLVSEGVIVLNANDMPSLSAYDTATGIELWRNESQPCAARTHVLGIQNGKLVFTTEVAVHALYLSTGKSAWSYPKTDPPIIERGKGLIAGNEVLWPTRNGIQFIALESGLPTRNLDAPELDDPEGKGGNLAYSNGFLAVAQAERLILFGPPQAKANPSGETKD